MPALVDGELYAQQLDVPPWTLAEAEGAALLSDVDWLLGKILQETDLPDDLIPHLTKEDNPMQPNDDDLIETLAEGDLVAAPLADLLVTDLLADDLAIIVQEGGA